MLVLNVVLRRASATRKVLKLAKGYFNARRKVFRVAKQAVTKAAPVRYIGRKQRKRSSVRVDRAHQRRARMYGMSYSRFMNAC